MKTPGELAAIMRQFSRNAINMSGNMKGLAAEIEAAGGMEYLRPALMESVGGVESQRADMPTFEQLQAGYAVLLALSNSVDAAAQTALFKIAS